jgi:hypothetical protein
VTEEAIGRLLCLCAVGTKPAAKKRTIRDSCRSGVCEPDWQRNIVPQAISRRWSPYFFFRFRFGVAGGLRVESPRLSAYSRTRYFMAGSVRRDSPCEPPLLLCCAALRLLLQGADVRDDVLNLSVGELARVALHLAHAVFGLLDQVSVSGLDILWRLEANATSCFYRWACCRCRRRRGTWRIWLCKWLRRSVARWRERPEKRSADSGWQSARILLHVEPPCCDGRGEPRPPFIAFTQNS